VIEVAWFLRYVWGTQKIIILTFTGEFSMLLSELRDIAAHRINTPQQVPSI
jgi:hypothetical protein